MQFIVVIVRLDGYPFSVLHICIPVVAYSFIQTVFIFIIQIFKEAVFFVRVSDDDFSLLLIIVLLTTGP